MVKAAVVGCTGKLGQSIVKNILLRTDIEVCYAVARKANRYVGHNISELFGGNTGIVIIDDIEVALDCDVIIDCTNAGAFIKDNFEKYEKLKKPLVIATTAFSENDLKKIQYLAKQMPVFMTGNFSIALHDFIETLKFAVKRVSPNTDIQIIEYHHREKKDAPSGTAIMIRNALAEANGKISSDNISVCSVRGGNIFGEHEVIFYSCRDEIVTFKHSVSSRETFAEGAISAMIWTAYQTNGLYGMDDLCEIEK